jgi:hypothetical protein
MRANEPSIKGCVTRLGLIFSGLRPGSFSAATITTKAGSMRADLLGHLGGFGVVIKSHECCTSFSARAYRIQWFTLDRLTLYSAASSICVTSPASYRSIISRFFSGESFT